MFFQTVLEKQTRPEPRGSNLTLHRYHTRGTCLRRSLLSSHRVFRSGRSAHRVRRLRCGWNVVVQPLLESFNARAGGALYPRDRARSGEVGLLGASEEVASRPEARTPRTSRGDTGARHLRGDGRARLRGRSARMGAGASPRYPRPRVRPRRGDRARAVPNHRAAVPAAPETDRSGRPRPGRSQPVGAALEPRGGLRCDEMRRDRGAGGRRDHDRSYGEIVLRGPSEGGGEGRRRSSGLSCLVKQGPREADIRRLGFCA